MSDAHDDSTYASRATAALDDSLRCFERDVLPLVDDLHWPAFKYTQNAADAEDLVQETLLRAFKAFGRLDNGKHLKAWLLTIMRNTWISNHRARVRRPNEYLVASFSEHGA